MAKVNYGKVQYKDKSGVLAETKNERVYLSGVSQEDFTKIAGDGGNKVYFEGVKKGIALSMEAGNEVLSTVKGLKGKDFMEGLNKAVTEKYGALGEKARVDFTNTVYFKDHEKKTTEQPRVVLTGLSTEAFTKIAQDKGKDVYIEGIKSGVALSMASANEVLSAAKGTKGKEFYDKIEEAISAKYGVKFGGSEQEIADKEAPLKVEEVKVKEVKVEDKEVENAEPSLDK